MRVKLIYFKKSGTYYSEGEFTSQETRIHHDFNIYSEVRAMRTEGSLPGLVVGAREFLILVTGEDIVPALII